MDRCLARALLLSLGYAVFECLAVFTSEGICSTFWLRCAPPDTAHSGRASRWALTVLQVGTGFLGGKDEVAEGLVGAHGFGDQDKV